MPGNYCWHAVGDKKKKKKRKKQSHYTDKRTYVSRTCVCTTRTRVPLSSLSLSLSLSLSASPVVIYIRLCVFTGWEKQRVSIIPAFPPGVRHREKHSEVIESVSNTVDAFPERVSLAFSASSFFFPFFLLSGVRAH